MKHLFAATCGLLGLLDTAARLSGTKGLRSGIEAAGLSLAALVVGRIGLPHPRDWALALPLAVTAHLAIASWRTRQLDPLEQLRPGEYVDRTIERLDVPGPHGPIPALQIRPRLGGRAAVLVVHGSGCDKTFYAWRLVDALIGRGLAVLLIDLDGHGESPRPQHFPTILGCVSGSVAWLRERYATVGVLGMSLGGAVATRAIAEGSRVEALVIEESPPQVRLDPRNYRRVQIREGQRLANPRLLHLLRDGGPVPVAKAWRTSGIRAAIGTWDLFDALDLVGSLQRIGAQPASQRPKTLLIYGDRDAIVPMPQASRVAAVANGWATFTMLRGASHLSLPSERRTIALASDWLASHLG